MKDLLAGVFVFGLEGHGEYGKLPPPVMVCWAWGEGG